MDTFVIGKIIKAQGIRGELKIKPLIGDLSKFENLESVFIGDKNEKYSVKNLDIRFGFVYLSLFGIEDRNASEKLRGLTVSVAKEDFGQLKEDEFLIDDLIGLDVFDEKNNFVGKVEGIDQYGAADVVTIYADGRECRVPLIKSLFCKVDIADGKIFVDRDLFDEVKLCD
ncbi:MAG: ribosome maturation factor RimM [Clostridia bacterium]